MSDSVTLVTQGSQRMLERVRALLRPALAADLQERIWAQTERLRELTALAKPPAPPTVARPRALPYPLNPFYFVRTDGAQGKNRPPS